MLRVNISTSCVLLPEQCKDVLCTVCVLCANICTHRSRELSKTFQDYCISSFRLFTLLKGKHLKEIQPSGAGTCWICSDIWRLSTRPSFRWLENPVFVACLHASQNNLIYHVNVSRFVVTPTDMYMCIYSILFIYNYIYLNISNLYVHIISDRAICAGQTLLRVLQDTIKFVLFYSTWPYWSRTQSESSVLSTSNSKREIFPSLSTSNSSRSFCHPSSERSFKLYTKYMQRADQVFFVSFHLFST